MANQCNLAAGKHVISARQINPYTSRPAYQDLYLDDMAEFLDP